MRPIKFRAWDKNAEILGKKTGIMVYEFYVRAWDGKPIQYDHQKEYDLSDDLILMQFTGLHDKNGKGIYEGDIVSDEFRVISVKWLNVGMWNICSLTDKKEWQKGLVKSFKKLKIIGNIYENPELLK